MADSALVLLSDALVTSLNGQTWSPAATAARELAADYELKDLDTIRLVVLPAGEAQRRASRASWDYTFLLHVGIHKRHGGAPGVSAPKTQLDPLHGLRAAVRAFIADQRLTADGATWTVTEIKPIALMVEEALAQGRAFASYLEVGYRRSL